MNGSILGMTKAEIDRKIEDIIDFSEVREFIDTPVKRYSSGMYVKLAFSVAAHLDAEIMIMDEVLAVGDMAFQKKCLDKMSQVSADEGRTILYVSHNMNTIRRLCDRCIVLEEGKIVFDGDVEKAIDIYVGEKKDTIQTHYVYDDTMRIENRRHPNFIMIESSVLGAEELECGDKFDITITSESLQEWRNVRFRFEFSLMNEMKIASMFCDNPLCFHKNEKSKDSFTIHTDHLTPGVYRVDIVASETDDLGFDHFLDGVYPGFLFEIKDRINKNNSFVWNQRYWGAIHLQDVSVNK